MVLKYVTKNGVRYHEPPYAKEQEAGFYSRTAGGPVTVARPAGDRKAPKSPITAAAVAGKCTGKG